MSEVLHIGFSNFVKFDKIVAIMNPDTVAAKRMRENATQNHTLIDATMGRKMRSMVLTDSEYIFLSCIRPEALLQRMAKQVTEGSQ